MKKICSSTRASPGEFKPRRRTGPTDANAGARKVCKQGLKDSPDGGRAP